MAKFPTPGRSPLEAETMGTNYPRDDDEPSDERQTEVAARAEYRPDEEVPLQVTIEVPEHVREAAGGFEELTETVEFRQ
jgi:hypothetical protein